MLESSISLPCAQNLITCEGAVFFREFHGFYEDGIGESIFLASIQETWLYGCLDSGALLDSKKISHEGESWQSGDHQVLKHRHFGKSSILVQWNTLQTAVIHLNNVFVFPCQSDVRMSSAGNLPPATPAYVLRGHTEPVHALHFYQQNSFLISGDSEGWVVIWRLSSKRPVACWRAHDGGILGIKQWESNVITWAEKS